MSRASDERKEAICLALNSFLWQRPGLEPGNYASISSYRAEGRSIVRDRDDARELLALVWRMDSVTAAHLEEGFRAFSGRLSILTRADGKVALQYCTGQYFPTEYRKAVCAVLSSALWSFWRGEYQAQHGTTEGARDYIVRAFARNFRHSVAKRWGQG